MHESVLKVVIYGDKLSLSWIYIPLGKLIYTTDFPPFVSTLPPNVHETHFIIYF